MASPTLVVFAVVRPSHIAQCVSDPMAFMQLMGGAYDVKALQTVAAAGRIAVSEGTKWGALLPSTDVDAEVAALREQYGDPVADDLQRVRAQEGPQAVLVWKVLMSVPKGRG